MGGRTSRTQRGEATAACTGPRRASPPLPRTSERDGRHCSRRKQSVPSNSVSAEPGLPSASYSRALSTEEGEPSAGDFVSTQTLDGKAAARQASPGHWPDLGVWAESAGPLVGPPGRGTGGGPSSLAGRASPRLPYPELVPTNTAALVGLCHTRELQGRWGVSHLQEIRGTDSDSGKLPEVTARGEKYRSRALQTWNTLVQASCSRRMSGDRNSLDPASEQGSTGPADSLFV